MKTCMIPQRLYPYFMKTGIQKHYHKNDIIYMQGDEASHLYLITKGRVRVYTLSRDGKETTMEIVEKGRIFGESSFLQDVSRPTTVSAINEVEVISCSLESMLPCLSESKELTLLLFQHLSNTNNHLSDLVNQAYFFNRYQKVAYFLLEQTSTPNIEKGITTTCIPYTHEEIALCTGLHRVTITKILHEFQDNGAISLSYRKVIIKDRAKLYDYLDCGKS